MKRDIYSCDTCDKVLSDEHLDIAVPHLSITLGKSGLAVVDSQNRWRFRRLIPPGVYHFCLDKSLECQVRFFNLYVVEEPTTGGKQ